MQAAIRLPVRILRAPRLSASAKLVWLFLIHNAGSDRQLVIANLANKSRLSPHTVRRAISELRDGGWIADASTHHAHNNEPVVCIPADLLLDKRLNVQAKLLYGTLQLIHNFRGSAGQFTFSDLGPLASASLNTLRQAAKRLENTGWVRIVQDNKYAPMRFRFLNPAAEQRASLKEAISRRLAQSKHHGETLMREYLNLLIENDEYDDNARPGFLVNPFTGEKMEFDRYYPPKVALEYNGPQHDGPTAKYPSEADARKQQARDAMKVAICKSRGVKLIVLRLGDLTLTTLRTKLKGVLALNDLDPDDPVVAHLERLSHAYRTRNS